jgi:hypothetical protein
VSGCVLRMMPDLGSDSQAVSPDRGGRQRPSTISMRIPRGSAGEETSCSMQTGKREAHEPEDLALDIIRHGPRCFEARCRAERKVLADFLVLVSLSISIH